jgi:hypothetical protein
MFIRLFYALLLLLGLNSCGLLRPPAVQLLSGKIHWQGEVRLHGDLVLEAGAELIIAPGTRVIFEPPLAGEDIYREHPYFPGSELIVRGRLIALGTPEEPIAFTAADPRGEAGSWGGINIEDSPETHFAYCRFEQADSAIHSRQSEVRVESSVFRNNLVGVRFHDTRLLVENNLFEGNGTAIRFHFGSPVIRNNLIRHNGKGLFITAEPRAYQIENNSFIENRPYHVSLGEGVREAVELRNNSWSESAGPALEKFFFDGRTDDWLGLVEYLPVRDRSFELELSQ